MARFAADDDIARVGVYEELVRREEEKFQRDGGQRLLIRDEMVTVDKPGPLLAALCAGGPVELMDWQVPRQFRGGKVGNRRVTVHPDGRVLDVDRRPGAKGYREE